MANFEKVIVGSGTNTTEIKGDRIRHNGQVLVQPQDAANESVELFVDGNLGAGTFLYCGKTIASLHGDITANEGVVKANDVLINSSQELKQDISNLTKEETYRLIENLEPVKFVFKNDPAKKENIGFIAEDVPDIVSDKDHKSVRYMEIISALTMVVKEQEKRIIELENKIS